MVRRLEIRRDLTSVGLGSLSLSLSLCGSTSEKRLQEYSRHETTYIQSKLKIYFQRSLGPYFATRPFGTIFSLLICKVFLKKCEALPLAIVAIGGLLSSKDKSKTLELVFQTNE
uniref:Uncharacterized protein n=1 Tax=Davidia involucrata TaxID=16924 RepID=A0A5B6YIY6_DAVIN